MINQICNQYIVETQICDTWQYSGTFFDFMIFFGFAIIWFAVVLSFIYLIRKLL